MTKTKVIDQNGNISYTLTEGTRVVGYVHKGSGYWRAELPSGNGASVASLKRGVELIAFWRRMLTQ
jgi:hypothetical protein